MSLLDPNIKSYVIKWKGGDIGGKTVAEIEKEDGEKLGNIKLKGTFKKKTELTDIEDSVVLTAHKSARSIKAKYDVKDSNGNKICTANQKIFARYKIMTIKDAKGNEILTCKGSNELTGIYEINSINGQNIAKFLYKKEIVKKSFWNADIFNTCLLKITDVSFDRKNLFGLFISYLSSFYDFAPAGGGG